MKKKRREFSFEEKMDMTPLIDAVFLLIMFFILTTEITVDIEEVALPFALEGSADKTADKDTVIILNIPLEKTQKKRGDAFITFHGEQVDEKRLQTLLQEEVKYDLTDPPYGRGRAPEVIPGNIELSQLKIRIRADKNAQADYLRQIFMVCAKVKPAIYKIEISSEQPSQN